MANNCDFCHKPLSLMRRLRGEQFCSLEHLEAYTKQQAEFALQRLAASVTDKPNTERPPALTRATPRLRPIARPATDEAASAPAGAPSVAAETPVTALDKPEVATAFAAPVPEPATPAVPAMSDRESDYPMAPYLEQAAIEPRQAQGLENRKIAFESDEAWGKLEHSWRMPPFHSEPSDPRSWDAGKMVAEIPPVTGWRPLVATRQLAAEESPAEPRWNGMLLSTVAFEASPSASPVAWTGQGPFGEPSFTVENRLIRKGRIALSTQIAAQSSAWPVVETAPAGAEFRQPAWMAFRTMPARLPEGEAQLGAHRSRPVAWTQEAWTPTPVEGEAPAPSLAHPGTWIWEPVLVAANVPLPLSTAAAPQPGRAAQVGDWERMQSAVQSPVTPRIGAQLYRPGASFGWDVAAMRNTGDCPPVIQADSLNLESFLRSPISVGLRATSLTTLPQAGPRGWSQHPTLRQNMTGLSGPLHAAATDAYWMPLVTIDVNVLKPETRSAPVFAGLRSTVGLVKPPAQMPTRRTPLRETGPVKYSPLAMVVIPAPEIVIAAGRVEEEQRYVALAPNGVWRLPRVRHSGYRSLGPFPKRPPSMPEVPSLAAVEMAARDEVMRLRDGIRKDVGMPVPATSGPGRTHPADYFVWPQPRGPKLGKMLPERESGGATEAAPIKRFGPARAGSLQDRRKTADGLARA